MRFRMLFAMFAAVVATSAGVSTEVPAATAAPLDISAQAPNGSFIESSADEGDRTMVLKVFSASMQKSFPVHVLRPADNSVPRPTLYLLNGGGGGVDGIATWDKKTDAMQFLGDKNINVVQVIGGPWSYYADWINPDPVLGVNKWQTFFTEELPPIINAALGTNGKNAMAGLSVAGTSVLLQAITKPGLFQNVASYSGCAQTSDPLGQRFIQISIDYGTLGADPRNLWGAYDNPLWAANDPYVHADRLRGTNLYIASGTGLPGQHDTMDSPFMMGEHTPMQLANQIVAGGVIEAATNYCSRNLQTRLGQLGIPATFDLSGVGTHSWGYWQDQLKKSWPVLSKDLY